MLNQNRRKPSLIVSTSALELMIFVWLPKPWIAVELNSSVMRGEAACSLACIYLTIVLFIGSIVYKVWPDAWWVDSAVAVLLGFFFFHDGWQMITWARSEDFNGGCCKTCSSSPVTSPFSINDKDDGSPADATIVSSTEHSDINGREQNGCTNRCV